MFSLEKGGRFVCDLKPTYHKKDMNGKTFTAQQVKERKEAESQGHLRTIDTDILTQGDKKMKNKNSE